MIFITIPIKGIIRISIDPNKCAVKPRKPGPRLHGCNNPHRISGSIPVHHKNKISALSSYILANLGSLVIGGTKLVRYVRCQLVHPGPHCHRSPAPAPASACTPAAIASAATIAPAPAPASTPSTSSVQSSSSSSSLSPKHLFIYYS